MSTAGRCMARNTSSGIVVGPGIARNSRPARTTISQNPPLFRRVPYRTPQRASKALDLHTHSRLRENEGRATILTRTGSVDRHDHATGIAGAVGCEKAHHIGDFTRFGSPPLREILHQFAVAALVTELVFGAGL